MNVVEGAEESKGELPEQDEDGLSPETPQPSPSAFPWHFSVQQALRQYNILAEGAREGGPDYTPCEWEPSMLLQDIPWRQLPLSVPLDVLLASSPPPTSRKFAGPLSTIFKLVRRSPVEASVSSADGPVHRHMQESTGRP